MQELRQSGAGPDEDCFKSVFKQFIHRNGFPDNGVVNNLHAHFSQVFNFSGNNLLRKTKLRNTVYQNTARFMKRFKYRDVITHFAKISGAGQAGRTGPDYRHPVSVGRRNRYFRQIRLRHMIVRNKALQPANADALPFQAANAL